MIHIFIFTFFLVGTQTFSQAGPEVESVAYAQAPEKREVIAKISHKGENWSLVRFTDKESGALYIFREKGGNSQIIGGDSSPFPLSRYSIPAEVGKKLADLYVQYEIQSTPGGLSALKKRVAGYNKIPHDLKDAYSKYMEVDALPLYISEGTDVEEMILVLKEAGRTLDPEDFKTLETKKLNPLLSFLIVQMANDPSEDLSGAAFEAVSSHPQNQGLQELIAVYAGRQQEFFLKQFQNLSSAQKARVIQALHGAIQNKLVGSVVKTAVKDLTLRLSQE